MAYVVRAKRRNTGEIITSQRYKNLSEAVGHLENTKLNWSNIYKNPRLKKVK